MIKGTLNLIEKTLESGSIPSAFSWLLNSAPCFALKGEQIQVLKKPQEFYNSVVDGCKHAKERIVLASLYLGNGHMEKSLVETIKSRIDEMDSLQVSILLDANRGSRGEINSRKMLIPLLNSKDQCQISLFHTPSLRGSLKRILPQRYNELVGLQHMKLYLFDNSVLISGANLSEDYFTNRQDRYILIKDCKELADFYSELVEKISSVSLGLDSSNNLYPRSFHPYKSKQNIYIKAARDKIWNFYEQAVANYKTSDSSHDTWVFPLLELPPLDIHQDSVITRKLLEKAQKGSQITLTTGYFNLTNEYTETIIKKSEAEYIILMAHPSANGFLKAGGLASGIPGAYTGLAYEFLKQVLKHGKINRITMFEYCRPGWTYHAKGLWYSYMDNLPVLTLIGSSNFGSRSVRRDIESQIAIITINEKLREDLKDEQDNLRKFTVPFTNETALEPSRKPALWVKTTMKIFKDFF